MYVSKSKRLPTIVRERGSASLNHYKTFTRVDAITLDADRLGIVKIHVGRVRQCNKIRRLSQ